MAKEKKFKLGPIQRAWVRALRSGKYKQTKNTLVRTTVKGKPLGYCCLGVLCDLAAKKEIVDVTIDNRCLAFDNETQDLPPNVMSWSGMRDCLGALEDELSSLAEANDHGKKFKQIAG